jgi:starvation-inducible outer membrane lipoprotein
MRLLLITLALLLSGCVATPVKHELPEAPEKLIKACPKLKEMPLDEERLTEFLKTVTQNYTTYYECAVKHDGLIEWYQIQKKIHDGVFNK